MRPENTGLEAVGVNRGDSASTRRAEAATTIPIGTLTNSTHRHDT
jgi:hypothetical protein